MLAGKIFELAEDGISDLFVELRSLEAHCVEIGVFAAVLDGLGLDRVHELPPKPKAPEFFMHPKSIDIQPPKSAVITGDATDDLANIIAQKKDDLGTSPVLKELADRRLQTFVDNLEIVSRGIFFKGDVVFHGPFAILTYLISEHFK